MSKEMSDIQRQMARHGAYQIPFDLGNEVTYAFGWLPRNAELNAEIYKRAAERWRQRALLGKTDRVT